MAVLPHLPEIPSRSEARAFIAGIDEILNVSGNTAGSQEWLDVEAKAWVTLLRWLSKRTTKSLHGRKPEVTMIKHLIVSRALLRRPQQDTHSKDTTDPRNTGNDSKQTLSP